MLNKITDKVNDFMKSKRPVSGFQITITGAVIVILGLIVIFG